MTATPDTAWKIETALRNALKGFRSGRPGDASEALTDAYVLGANYPAINEALEYGDTHRACDQLEGIVAQMEDMRRSQQTSEQTINRFAIHEAGHVVVAQGVGAGVLRAHVDLDSGGAVEPEHRVGDIGEIAISFAGIFAEMILCSDFEMDRAIRAAAKDLEQVKDCSLWDAGAHMATEILRTNLTIVRRVAEALVSKRNLCPAEIRSLTYDLKPF